MMILNMFVCVPLFEPGMDQQSFGLGRREFFSMTHRLFDLAEERRSVDFDWAECPSIDVRNICSDESNLSVRVDHLTFIAPHPNLIFFSFVLLLHFPRSRALFTSSTIPSSSSSPSSTPTPAPLSHSFLFFLSHWNAYAYAESSLRVRLQTLVAQPLFLLLLSSTLLSSCPPWITRGKDAHWSRKLHLRCWFFFIADLSLSLVSLNESPPHTGSTQIFLLRGLHWSVSTRMALKRINKELLELEKE